MQALKTSTRWNKYETCLNALKQVFQELWRMSKKALTFKARPQQQLQIYPSIKKQWKK